VQAHSYQTTVLAIQESNQYQTDFIPFCAQSPLLARIATYTGACLLNRTRQMDTQTMMSTKGRAIQMLNKMLAEQSTRPSDEAISGVITFVSTDICHDETQHLRIHFEGLREMIRLRGGLQCLGMDGLLAKLAAM